MNGIDLSLFEPEVIRLLEAIRSSAGISGQKTPAHDSSPTKGLSGLNLGSSAASSPASSTAAGVQNSHPSSNSQNAAQYGLRGTSAFQDTHPSILTARSAHEARVLANLETVRVELGVHLASDPPPDQLTALQPFLTPSVIGRAASTLSGGESPGPVIEQVRSSILLRTRNLRARPRPLYAAEDLLDFLVTAANTSAATAAAPAAAPTPSTAAAAAEPPAPPPSSTAAAAAAPTPSSAAAPRMRLHEAALQFPYFSLRDLSALVLELDPKNTQHGLDDLFDSQYDAARRTEGEKLLSSGPPDPARARVYLRRGCPPSLRGPMWTAALGLPHLCGRQVDVWRKKLGSTAGGAGGEGGAGKGASAPPSRPSSARRARPSDDITPLKGSPQGSSPTSLSSATGKEGGPRRTSFSLLGGGRNAGSPGGNASDPSVGPSASFPSALPEILEERARCATWFLGLQRESLRKHLLTDLLAMEEARRICNTDRFFIFEDSILTVLIGLTRDPSLSWGASLQPHPLTAGYGRKSECHGLYPPSGLLPFKGLAAYVAPLCYILEEPTEVFHVAKKLYQDLFCRLHVLSAIDEPETVGSLLSLCGTFTRILHEADPQLSLHLESLGEGGSPLELAFPWIVGAFAEHLEVDQLFYLWDRVIGYRSLLPVTILAAGILLVKRDLLQLAQSAAEARECLRDLSRINVAAVLQVTLYGGAAGGSSRGSPAKSGTENGRGPGAADATANGAGTAAVGGHFSSSSGLYSGAAGGATATAKLSVTARALQNAAAGRATSARGTAGLFS